MEDLAAYFNSLGYDVLNVALHGHRGSLSEMRTTDYRALYGGVWRHLEALIDEAGDDEPIVFVGYSTGAVLQGNLLYNFPRLLDRRLRIVWIAPAFELRWHSRLTALMKGPFILPSFSPASYRAGRGASFNAYGALDEGRKRFKRDFTEEPGRLPPALVAMDPKDELVSWPLNRRLFSDHPRVRFAALDNRDSDLAWRLHHIVIDKKSLGLSGWARLTSLIGEFLKEGGEL